MNTINSSRFQVILFISKYSKPYFLPLAEWKEISQESGDVAVIAELISHVPHGFKTRCFPTTTSAYHVEPFFVVAQSNLRPENNLLKFNSFFRSNSEEAIIAMLWFSEQENRLTASFAPKITFFPNEILSLNNIMEFLIVDSNKKRVSLVDKSKLFLKIIIH